MAVGATQDDFPTQTRAVKQSKCDMEQLMAIYCKQDKKLMIHYISNNIRNTFDLLKRDTNKDGYNYSNHWVFNKIGPSPAISPRDLMGACLMPYVVLEACICTTE
jgi:hypothetical protein